jgi:hypothetical protein
LHGNTGFVSQFKIRALVPTRGIHKILGRQSSHRLEHFLCELESMNFKKYIKHRRGSTSRMVFFIGLVYFAIMGFESVFILWLTPFVSIAFAYSWSDDMRLLADQTAKTDPRVAALIY